MEHFIFRLMCIVVFVIKFMEVGIEGCLDMLMLCACCLFICTLKHTQTHTNTHNKHTQTHAHKHTQTHTNTYIQIHTNTQIHTYKHTQTNTQTHKQTHTHTHIYIYIYTYTHTHSYTHLLLFAIHYVFPCYWYEHILEKRLKCHGITHTVCHMPYPA